MRVLLAVGWYFPDAVGGTEVYVRGLASRLQRAGLEVTIAAPKDGGQPVRYVHRGVTVFRFPVAANPSRTELRGLERPPEFEVWEQILQEAVPHVVDFHSFTRGLGLPHLRAAAERGAAVVLTVHAPGFVCARGTLLRFGRVPCDGDLARQPCTECRLHGRGLPRPVATLASHVPATFAGWSARVPLPSPLRRLLRAPEADVRRRAQLQEAFARADRVVAVSRWLADVLLRNGLPSTKLSLCPQGAEETNLSFSKSDSGRLRIGFIGRYDPVKGLHVLVKAIRRLPRDVPISCHVWGSGTSSAACAYRRQVEGLAGGDTRIQFHPPVVDAGEALAELDVLIIPSVWMETGPLVLLEAFAAGVPVVGSDLGGIAERVRGGVDGVLVPPGHVRALSRELLALATDRARLRILRAGIAPVRAMDDVAADTLALYRSLTGKDWSSDPAPHQGPSPVEPGRTPAHSAPEPRRRESGLR